MMKIPQGIIGALALPQPCPSLMLHKCCLEKLCVRVCVCVSKESAALDL